MKDLERLLEMDFYQDLIEGPRPIIIKRRSEFSKRMGKALAPMALTAIGSTTGTILGAGVTAYLKRRANFCRQMTESPEEYAKCMAKFRVKALQRRKEILENKKVECGKKRDPEKCRASIDAKIDIIERIIDELKVKRGLD